MLGKAQLMLPSISAIIVLQISNHPGINLKINIEIIAGKAQEIDLISYICHKRQALTVVHGSLTTRLSMSVKYKMKGWTVTKHVC